MRVAAAVLLCLVLLSCSRSDTRNSAPPGEAPSDDRVGGSFVDEGTMGSFERPSADARTVRGLRLERQGDRVRFVILLGDSTGAPSRSPGAVNAELAWPLGVVRVRLDRLVRSTSLADTAFGDSLAGRAFVVRSTSRSLFVDLHLREPVQARTAVFSNPGRVVVELRRGGRPLPPPPAVAPRTILLAPRGIDTTSTKGATLGSGHETYPLTVWGYSRNFEANVVAELRQNGVMAQRSVTQSADYAETWGEFRLRLGDGPRGRVELFVGDYSAKDGSEDGVRVPLFME